MAPRRLTDKTPLDKAGLSHIILLAQNREGYHNLCKLATIAQLEGFYYKPRIDKEVLKEFSKGLIGFSGCMRGEISRLFQKGRMDQADEAARFYLNVFGEGNFFLEVQENGIDIQEEMNQALLEMSKRLSIPLLATNDCHYLDKTDVRAHDVLLCIQTGKTVHDDDRLRFTTDQLYLKSKEEMYEAFKDYPDSDGVFLGGGAWISFPVVEVLEKEFGKPVITNETGAIWHACHLIDYWRPVSGRGRPMASE